MQLSRRQMMKLSAVALAAGMAGNLTANTVSPYKIGSWINGIDAFEKAKTLGLDCVQMSFPLRPGAGRGDDFRDPAICESFVQKSKETGISISSLAMGDFNGSPFWEIDDAEQRVGECIEAMIRLNTKVVLIAFFSKGELKTEEAFKTTIQRLQRLAPKAEKAGVVLAVESTLGAEEHLRIVNEVNSPAVKVYYDPGNMIHRFGTTEKVCDDIRALKGQIAETHAKDQTLLGEGKIDYAKIIETFRQIGYAGPLVLEGSISKELGWDNSHLHNAAYLRKF